MLLLISHGVARPKQNSEMLKLVKDARMQVSIAHEDRTLYLNRTCIINSLKMNYVVKLDLFRREFKFLQVYLVARK